MCISAYFRGKDRPNLIPSWGTNQILPGKKELISNRFAQQTQTPSWAEWNAHPRNCEPKPTPALHTEQGLQSHPQKCPPLCRAAFPLCRAPGEEQQFWVRRCAGAARGAGAEQGFVRKIDIPSRVELTCLWSCSCVSTCNLRFLMFLMAWTGWTCNDIFPPDNPGCSAPLQSNHPELVSRIAFPQTSRVHSVKS